MRQFIDILGGELKRPVLDATGVKGVFDIALDWAPQFPTQNPQRTAEAAPNATDAPDNRPSIFTAVEEQLGLKLEAGKSPIETLVVDRAESASEN